MWFIGDEQVVPDDARLGGFLGFVYLITNQMTGRRYVGKKLFLFRRSKRKGKRKTKVLLASDWWTYWSSCKELQEDVAKAGEHWFRREILHLCRTRGEMSYLELKEQIERDVLRRPNEYYNSYVGARIHRNHLPKEGDNEDRRDPVRGRDQERGSEESRAGGLQLPKSGKSDRPRRRLPDGDGGADRGVEQSLPEVIHGGDGLSRVRSRHENVKDRPRRRKPSPR